MLRPSKSSIRTTPNAALAWWCFGNVNGGQELCDALDVHGSRSGIPVWMTEARWKELRITERPSVPLIVLKNLRALLASLRSVSNCDTEAVYDLYYHYYFHFV